MEEMGNYAKYLSETVYSWNSIALKTFNVYQYFAKNTLTWKGFGRRAVVGFHQELEKFLAVRNYAFLHKHLWGLSKNDDWWESGEGTFRDA